MDWKYDNGRIYSTNEQDELMAEATYALKANGEADINHTYVNPALRGKGIAGQMMEIVAKHLREKQLKATATCSYANTWLQRHRDSYADIISGDLESEANSCRIDGKH